jgi:DNA-binding CsgD family transcriptional regulator
MEHILVFVFLAIFICGFWTAVVIRQQYRATGVLLLWNLFRYVVSFNLLVFCFLLSRYIHANLVGEDPATFHPAIITGFAAAAFAVETCVIWTTLHLVFDLKQRTIPPILRHAFLPVISLIGISYVIGATVLLRGGSHHWIEYTNLTLGLLMVLAYGYGLLGLVAGRNSSLSDGQRRSARYFGWFLIGGILSVAASLTFLRSYYVVGLAVGLLWLSYAPMLWLRRYSQPYIQTILPGEVSSVVAVLARRYGITRREQEIMALLVEGKSNKEIEDQLCISFSTVKNHVYNLYRKLEVNSRAQLMHLVMVESARQEP